MQIYEINDPALHFGTAFNNYYKYSKAKLDMSTINYPITLPTYVTPTPAITSLTFVLYSTTIPRFSLSFTLSILERK